MARADVYADALAGGPLAGAAGGPVLLSDGDGLSAPTGDELSRLDPDTVYLLGGDRALEPAVESDVAGLLDATDVRRIAGDDRFATAAAVGAELADVAGDELAERAYVAQGIHEEAHRGWPDPLAVATLATHEQAPVLLSRAGEVPTATTDVFEALDLGEAVLVGGEVALEPAVESALQALA